MLRVTCETVLSAASSVNQNLPAADRMNIMRKRAEGLKVMGRIFKSVKKDEVIAPSGTPYVQK